MQNIEKSYWLAKQIPSIKFEMVIESNYGWVVVDDPKTIAGIKAAIIKRVSSWN